MPYLETDSLVDNERIAMFEIMDGLPAKGSQLNFIIH